jgi:cytochrome P450
MSGELSSASLVENARFNALVVVPNALQGLFRRRELAVRVATAADVDRWAVGLLRGMRRGHDGGPVWVRVIRDRALLLLREPDIRRVLEGSPDPFASDPEAKRKGMSAFQPDALTISRGELWENRRRFAEAILDTGKPLHRLADRFAAVACEEAEAMLGSLEDGELRWSSLHPAFRRATRRVVFGDAARDDEELSDLLGELMSAANGLPSDPPEKLGEFLARVERYAEAAEDGSLVALAAQAPADDQTKASRQFTHWVFAMQDTLAINSLRALAVLAAHPGELARAEDELRDVAGGEPPRTGAQVAGLEYLDACLEEAMRLWPSTPMLSRETTSDIQWNGTTVPAGTQVLIVNTFQHRDPDTHDFADRFAPEAWIEGQATDDWSFNHFSHGPQGCPGAGLALFLGKAIIATVLARRRLELESPRIRPERPLPHMLDFFAIRVAVEPRRGGATLRPAKPGGNG